VAGEPGSRVGIRNRIFHDVVELTFFRLVEPCEPPESPRWIALIGQFLATTGFSKKQADFVFFYPASIFCDAPQSQSSIFLG
jgi:hypothetical protein